MKDELCKIVQNKGLDGMIEYIRFKESESYEKGLNSVKDKSSYEIGYKDGKNKGFSDSVYDDMTRYK